MNKVVFSDCEYRLLYEDELYCKNRILYVNVESKQELKCDNCKENIHLNCTNYNPKKDMCLKWFETGVSRLTECAEKSTFSDKNLSKKWSN